MQRREATRSRWWAVLGAGVLVLGCESSERGARPAAPQTPPPQTTAEPSAMPNLAQPAKPVLIDVEAEPLHAGTLVVNEPLSIMHPSGLASMTASCGQGPGFDLADSTSLASTPNWPRQRPGRPCSYTEPSTPVWTRNWQTLALAPKTTSPFKCKCAATGLPPRAAPTPRVSS